MIKLPLDDFLAIVDATFKVTYGYNVTAHKFMERFPTYPSQTQHEIAGDIFFTDDSKEPEPKFDIDVLLEQVCPSISYLQYRKIFKTCISILEMSSRWGKRETEKSFDFVQLHALLIQMSLISE